MKGPPQSYRMTTCPAGLVSHFFVFFFRSMMFFWCYPKNESLFLVLLVLLYRSVLSVFSEANFQYICFKEKNEPRTRTSPDKHTDRQTHTQTDAEPEDSPGADPKHAHTPTQEEIDIPFRGRRSPLTRIYIYIYTHICVL